MTAVVGILNKKAIAIAADSAVTFSNGKIINRANKIFTLSKYQPVGIMIHNTDSFMLTPWETIIKMYRKHLNDRSYSTLQEYQEDFIKYLHEQNFFCDHTQQLNGLKYTLTKINEIFIKECSEGIGIYDEESRGKVVEKMKGKLHSYIKEFSENKVLPPEFEDYSFESFKAYAATILDEVLDYSYYHKKLAIANETKELLIELYYHFLRTKDTITINTGLVFSGYGDAEFFPSLYSLKIYNAFDNRLRYFKDDSAVISHERHSDIKTYAQYDVMHTILRGIAPELREAYSIAMKDFLKSYDDILLKNVEGNKTDIDALIKKVDKERVVDDMNRTMEEIIFNKYVNPLFDAVALLSKEDLAEMAESLIYLTYIKRRITNAEESVGGPIDVALLTKGDGFIWIKRKHYFKPELNAHFFSNYFR